MGVLAKGIPSIVLSVGHQVTYQPWLMERGTQTEADLAQMHWPGFRDANQFSSRPRCLLCYPQIAQAASTRVDMLPKVYLDEFCRLQDNVRTFSTVEARFVLEEGLGRPVDTVFEWLSEEPLAAASLGQVGVCSVLLGWRTWGVG